MGFNQVFFKFSEILGSPFSTRKRKRAQAEPLSDSVSARPTKQTQRPPQPGALQAAALSHQSNTRVPALPAQTQHSLPQPADQDIEASSDQVQPELRQDIAATALPSISGTGNWPAAHTLKPDSSHRAQSDSDLQQSGLQRLQPYQLPSEREQALQRRVEATERQMAELQQELRALRNSAPSNHHRAEGVSINLQEREQYGRLVELSKARDAQNALQDEGTQQAAADSSGRDAIVLDDAGETPVPAAHAYRGNTQQEQRFTPGRKSQSMQGQQNNSVHTSALHQTDAIPRFGPDHAASSGFSPGFRAIPSARLASKAGNGNSPSFTAPAHLRSGRLGGSVRTAGQKLAADPQRRLLDQLMEELSMHQPYDPLAPLEPGPGTQQSEVSSATQLDLDEVIARAKNVTGDSQSSLKQAATQAAEIQAQHKSFIRRSQAAQSPLPQLPGKDPAQAAQSRRRTAAVPRKGEEDESEEEEDESDSESELSAAFSGLGRLEPVGKPTKAMLEWKEKAFAPGPDSEKLLRHVHSGVDVARKDIGTLKSRQWLNDEVMNVYMGLLQERDVKMRKLGGFPKCHFFNTFFINKLYNDDKKYLYKNVRRWTNKLRLERWGQPSEKVTECDKLIIPVHLGCHWTCAVINLRDQEILYFDSLGGKEHEIVESLARYVMDEYQDKCQQKVDTSDWPRRSPDNIPKQLNGCDCGVFALMFAEYQSRDAAFTFDQRHMEYFRVKVVADIMSQKIDIPKTAPKL